MFSQQHRTFWRNPVSSCSAACGNFLFGKRELHNRTGFVWTRGVFRWQQWIRSGVFRGIYCTVSTPLNLKLVRFGGLQLCRCFCLYNLLERKFAYFRLKAVPLGKQGFNLGTHHTVLHQLNSILAYICKRYADDPMSLMLLYTKIFIWNA